MCVGVSVGVCRYRCPYMWGDKCVCVGDRCPCMDVWVCVGDRLLVCGGGGVSVGDRCVCVQVCVY